jgi:hypothetical protein
LLHGSARLLNWQCKANSSDFRSLSEQTTDKGVKSVNYIKKQLEEMEKKEEKGRGNFTAGDSPAEYGRPAYKGIYEQAAIVV